MVNWGFEPSQPLGIISGLKEIFIKRYHIVERNSKTKKKKKAGRIESENKELSGEFMECNTVERAIKT